MKKFNGFTLVEIMVTIVILGMIVSFAIPTLMKSVEKGRARRAKANLMSIHAALHFYHGNADTFLATDQASLASINSALSLNLIDDSFDYSYDYVSADQFAVTASRTSGAYDYQITHAPITSSNPSCVAGSCPL